MGQLKQSLIDTEQEDQTDPRDTFSPPESHESEVATGWAVFELLKAAKHLHDNAFSLDVGDLQDISKATLLLQDIPSKINKPF